MCNQFQKVPSVVNNGILFDSRAVKAIFTGVDGPNFVATIQGYTGHDYQLQYREDLSSGTWTNIGPAVPGKDAQILLPHTEGATAHHSFCHVAVGP